KDAIVQVRPEARITVGRSRMVKHVQCILPTTLRSDGQIASPGVTIQDEVAPVVVNTGHAAHQAVDNHLCIAGSSDSCLRIARIGGPHIEEPTTSGEHQY